MVDAADASTFCQTDLDESLFTPLLTPRVLNDDVVRISLLVVAVTHCKHTMVNIGATLFRVQNSTFVELENF